MPNIFNVKHGDGLPVLEVELLKSNIASLEPFPQDVPFDLTGTISVTLVIKLAEGGEITRSMEIYDRVAGLVRYHWQQADWDEITVGPALPLSPGQVEHRMEYRALTPGGPMTFPTSSYDTLRVRARLG